MNIEIDLLFFDFGNTNVNLVFMCAQREEQNNKLFRNNLQNT